MRHVAAQPSIELKPLSEPVLLILTSLAAHPRHGYALIKDIELLSGGRVRMSTGTLFGALRRLLEDGWIERFELEDTARQKQAYRLTASGRAQLEWELDRMRQLTRAGIAINSQTRCAACLKKRSLSLIPKDGPGASGLPARRWRA